MDHVKNRKVAFKKIESLKVKFDDHVNNPISIPVAKRMLSLVQDAWRKVEESNAQAIAASTTDEAQELQIRAYEPMFEKYLEVELQATGIISALETAAAAVAVRPTPAAANIRLPAMELPTFDGALEEWKTFKDLFEATIGNNLQLTGSQRLQYLKTTLKGKAADQIATLSTTDAHYTEAWTILTKKYENVREIVHALIRKILEYKTVKSENSGELQALMDNVQKCTRSLKVLGRPVKEWDDILIVIIVSKLDPSTRREWAIRQTGTDLPTFKKFEDFVQGHIRGLLAAGSNPGPSSKPVRFEKGVKVHHAAVEQEPCPVCSKPHTVFSCRELKSKSPAERSALVRRLQLCYNCLGSSHMSKECPSSGTCRQCGNKHHTLLHVPRSTGAPSGNPTSTTNSTKQPSHPKSQPPTTSANVGSHHVAVDENCVLMTAVVTVPDMTGRAQPCRVFIDPGSQADFVTESCVRRLGLQRSSCSVGVGGIGGVSAGRSRGKVTMTLSSRHDDADLDVQLLIMQKLTDLLPSVRCHNKDWRHIQGLQLADPQWYSPAPVDIILGIKHYSAIKLDQKIGGANATEPTAWNTIFGWAISGACPAERQVTNTYHISIDLVDTFLRRFWEVEEPPKAKFLTVEEKLCEAHFKNTYSREDDGRFVVAIPFNEKKNQLGASKPMAVSRFKQVERRLQRQPHFKEQYVSFMREYEVLGHMEKVPQAEQHNPSSLYLCHHGVVNDSSSTTKMRVVFDGSAQTSTGVSLNNAMHVGATLQDDLYDILLRFRTHRVVLKGDIAKMFRQFKLKKEDADYHRIIWRENPDDPLEEYRLLTVTYGTACAPNLATRCLQQLALDVKDTHPMASKALHNDTYVDDVLTGGDSDEEAVLLYNDLVKAVSTGGMELRKWSSNSPAVLSAIPEAFRETDPTNFDLGDQMVKALGIQWIPTNDTLTFKTVNFKHEGRVTKRMLYSDLARVFDPLGIVSCVTIRGKLLLQSLWSLAIDWDENVPLSVQMLWNDYKQDLISLVKVSLPRQIIMSPSRNELHCFCDSSERALGYILYMKSIFPNNTVQVSLVTSKTKVAPLKQKSIPRLELDAAKGGAELTSHVEKVLSTAKYPSIELYLWSDSTITLNWIAGEPRRWKTYVANRVSIIQELIPKESWHHVPGIENPADLASRGVTAADLECSTLWWHGPDWLHTPTLAIYPTPPIPDGVDMEEKPPCVEAHTVSIAEDWCANFSSWRKLIRVAACIQLFIDGCQRKKSKEGSQSRVSKQGPFSAKSFYLSPSDLENGKKRVIKSTQFLHFSSELKHLSQKKEVATSSVLKTLFPYLDNQGIIRVSGRLQKSSFNENKQHLIILPGSSHLVNLLVRWTHLRNLHAGFQFTWAQLGMEYWITRGRDKVRHILRSCVVCRRYRAKSAEQLMGQLPVCRVTPHRAFLHTGVDYAGPFGVKAHSGRGWKVVKSWICLFICMSSKAIHLEMVDSLSTEAFLAALRRFVSRRGHCAHIYSDCATTFVGGDRELKEYLLSIDTNKSIADKLTNDGIQWHFLPPHAPHQGGLWEAGVKSAKHHLRRIIGNLTFTKESFGTLLCEVEAVLNSRPLYQRSADPNDMEALTPGHLLVGEPLTAIPTPDLKDVAMNRLNQYQLVENRVQEFWRRWSREYINTLQQRNKWMWTKQNVGVGDLVLLVEDSPPASWKMGRIETLHTGEDGLVRSVTLKTATTSLKRPIVKLVPLLSHNE